MKKLLLLLSLAALAVGCMAASVPLIVTVSPKMDDGDNCTITDDITTWPLTATRFLDVQTKLHSGSTWTTALHKRIVANGDTAMTITVPSYGSWDLRAMVSDSTGGGCWSSIVMKQATGKPSVVAAR